MSDACGREAPIRGEAVVELARECGFPIVGVTPATPIGAEDERRLRAWIDAGKHGEMSYIADRVEQRVDPQRAMPGARSMILVAEQYWRRNPDGRFPADPSAEAYLEAGVGRIARYARGADYHKVMKKRLFGLADRLRERYAAELAAAAGEVEAAPSDGSGDAVAAGVKAFVDTAPIMERLHAARAGLGWIAKNSLLIHQRRGSYLFVGGILTTLEIARPKNQRAVPDRCGTCVRCIEACPTAAIEPYSVDASRCISYLTIEHRSAIERRWHGAMGEWVFGCDICQEVCPHNSPRTGRAGTVAARGEYEPGSAERRLSGSGFDLLAMLGWTEADRRAATARSALKRARLEMLRRNAAIAAGNSLNRCEDSGLRAKLEAIAADAEESPMVREAAREALQAQV